SMPRRSGRPTERSPCRYWAALLALTGVSPSGATRVEAAPSRWPTTSSGAGTAATPGARNDGVATDPE
ncbi:MAG: hypothetical protein M3457_20815, partial [Chloroflexota bacterium]|nr:hypothetical protein [Chloroflexota bacterium]